MGLFTSLTFFLAAIATVDAAQLLSVGNQTNVIPNNYIVVLKKGNNGTSLNSHVSWVSHVHRRNLAKRSENSTDFHGVKKQYKMQGFTGYAGSFGQDTLQAILKNDDVAYVEQDHIATGAGWIEQSGSTWGLARISHRKGRVPGYIYNEQAGQGVTAYVIDSGVDVTHPDFNGRAYWGANFINNINRDENGHGTHCAGTVGSTTYGVAKKARIVAVKVLDADKQGPWSVIIAGLEWIVQNARQSNLIGKAVVSMSIYGGPSQAINDATSSTVRAGLFVAVCAGNDNANTANFSPANDPNVCTIGATDQWDNRASFSNWGNAVDIFGPGVDVLSLRPGGGTAVMSGTSMATPHVAGVAAILLATTNIGANQMCSRLVGEGTSAVINPGSGSPNGIVYNGSGQ